MTYILKSLKAGKTFTTKDLLKDEAWGNEYYGVDDCIRVEVIEQTQVETEKQERISRLMAEIQSLEQKIYYSELDGETEWANQKKAQRLALKQELRSLNASS